MAIVCLLAEAVMCVVSATYGFPGYWTLFVASLLGAFLALLLIYGAKENKPQNLKLWVQINSCLLVTRVTISTVLAFVSVVYALIGLCVFIILLQSYSIVVVRSYAVQLEREINAAIGQSSTQQLYVLYL